MTDQESSTEVLNTKPKPFCFVLMPFSDDFKDVYEIAIKEACKNGGAYCERVDEQDFHETSIFQRIVNQISQADFIIADMSGKNANVFYEVGYAHALGKPTVLLTSNSSDIPFDLKHFPHLIYDRKHITDLRDKLTQKVRWFVENPIEKSNESEFELELYYGSNRLADAPLVLLSKETGSFKFRGNLTIHNTGNRKIDSSAYSFNVLSKFNCRIVRYIPTGSVTRSQTLTSKRDTLDYHETNIEPVFLPDDSLLYSLKNLPSLLPNAYESIEISIICPEKEIGSESNEFVFRIITENGSRDFRLQLRL